MLVIIIPERNVDTIIIIILSFFQSRRIFFPATFFSSKIYTKYIKYSRILVYTCIYRLIRREIRRSANGSPRTCCYYFKGDENSRISSIIDRIIIDQIGDAVIARFNGKRFALKWCFVRRMRKYIGGDKLHIRWKRQA